MRTKWVPELNSLNFCDGKAMAARGWWMRTAGLSIVCVATFGWPACSEDKSGNDLDSAVIEDSGTGSSDTSNADTTTDTAAPADVVADIGADAVSPDTQQDPIEVDFEVVARNGAVGLGLDTIGLAAVDEVGAYAGLPGLQFDVRIHVSGSKAGDTVTLELDRTAVNTQPLLMEPATNEGVSTFIAVQLDGPTHVVRAIHSGGAVATKTITVEVLPCDIQISPNPGTCFGDDADAETAGVQATFHISHTQKRCTVAQLTVETTVGTVTSPVVPLDEEGKASISVTVSSSTDPVDHQNVVIAATVSDPRHPERTGSTGSLDYTVDQVPPVVTLTGPVGPGLTFDDDTNPNENGIQIAVSGTVTGGWVGAPVVVSVDGVVVAETPILGDNTFLLENVSFTETKIYTVTVTYADTCGNEATATTSFPVVAQDIGLAIVQPENGINLLAKDDIDPTTEFAYDTVMVVAHQPALPNTQLRVQCRSQAHKAVYLTLAELPLSAGTIEPSGLYSFPVTVDLAVFGNPVACRAVVMGGVQKTSADVLFQVALPPPILSIAQPGPNERWKSPIQAGLLVGDGLGGITPTWTAIDEQNQTVAQPPAPAFSQGTATVSIDLRDSEGNALPDGYYTLQTQATDGFGNQASDHPTSVTEREILLDTTPPKVTLLSPEEGEIPEDVDPGTPGTQVVVRVQVTDGGPPLPGEVCVIELPDFVAVCETLPAFPATIEPVTITMQPGENAIMVIATDAAGNETKSQRTVQIAGTGPKIQLLSPKSLSVTNSATVSVSASITPLVGLSMADLELRLDGAPTPAVPTVTGPNIVTFADVAISEGPHTVQVVVTPAAKAAGSAIVGFVRKTASPSISLDPIADVLNGTSAQCLGGARDCRLVVSAATTAVEDGQPAQLEVSCSNFATQIFGAIVRNHQAVWHQVILHDQSTCTLTAKTVDAVGIAVADEPTTVIVDRTRPILHGFTSPNSVILQYNTDENVFVAGMQKSITLSVSGVEQGQLLQVFGQSDLSLPFLVAEVVIPKDIPAGAPLTISLGQQNLPDGVLALTAKVSDKAGNVAYPIGKLVLVVSNQPLVNLLGPNYIPPTTCLAETDCPMGAICADGVCSVGWNADSVREVLVEMTGVSIGNNPVRVCSNADGLPGPQCTKAGYRQVVSKPVNASLMALDVSMLPDGLHNIVVEAETIDGAGIWVQSADNPTESYQSRRIWVDTVIPAVGSLIALSDTLAPTGVLSQAEQVGPETFLFYVGAAEDGVATVYVDGLPRASQTLVEGSAQIPIQFKSNGTKLVQATVTDTAKNTSVLADSPSLSLLVSTTPPVAKFVSPATSPINKTTWTPLVISAPDNTLVTVLDGGQPVTPPLNPVGGVLSNSALMSDGIHEFSAEVVDFAGNKTVIFTEPNLVEIDTKEPTVTWITPTSTTLTDEDDASPNGGFQVTAVFEAKEAQAWSVWLASGCSEAYTSCAPAVMLASGSIGKDGPQPALTLTIPGASTHHVLSVQAKDAAGNSATASANLSVELIACKVSLTGLPLDGVLNAGDCPDGTPCTSVTVPLGALVTGPCGSIDTISLYLDGVPIAQDPNAADYEASLATSFDDGTVGSLELIVTHQGKIVTTSGSIALLVDLSPPQVEFVKKTISGFQTPGTNESVLWGTGADQSPDQAGLQVHVALMVSDTGPVGGQVYALQQETPSGLLPVAAVGLPGEITSLPFQKEVLFVTLPHAAKGNIVATAVDAAGNSGVASFAMEVDLLPPDAPNLEPLLPQDTVPRMPAVTLRFAPPADDAAIIASGPAKSLDVRYSRLPITTEAEFLAACKMENIPGGLPTPEILPPGVGLVQQVVISGPDPRPANVLENGNPCKFVTLTDNGTYWFAVRAQDDAGNLSPFVTASTTSTNDLRLRYATITPTLMAPQLINFQRTVAAIGDVNGDGLGDVALGGQSSHGFCVVFGHEGQNGGFWSNLTIDGTDGPHHQCFLDATPTGAGTNISAAGDVNGDGVDDFLVAAGFVDAAYPEQTRVYLGSTTAKLVTSPALTITGTKNGYVYGPQLGGNGNFNGDAHPSTKLPIGDIIVASRSENKAYIVPGAALWPKATCNLLDASDRTAFNVVTLSLGDGDSQAGFGYRVGFVGNVLPSVFGAFDEAYVTQSKGITQVMVIPGRPVSGGLTLTYSQAGGGTQPDDDEVVRLRPEMGIVTATFGADVRGGVDVDNDQVVDVLANHPSDKKMYIFSGAALKNKLGLIVRTESAVADGYGEGMLLGKNGVVLTGAWAEPCWLGNFDGDDKVSDGTPDLVYGIYDLFAATYGKVLVRLNTDVSGEGWFGGFPYVDMTIQNPVSMNTPTALGSTIRCPGDLNGDGFPDIIVGTNGEGWALAIQ